MQSAKCIAVAGIMLSATASANAQEKTVRIWANSFIPREHTSVKDFAHKTEKGTWVIKAPDLSAVSFATPEHIKKLNGTCFSTDDRLFDSDPNASARAKIDLTIKFTSRRDFSVGPSVGRDKMIFIGETHNIDCKTGKDLQPAKSAVATGISIGGIEREGFTRKFAVKVSAGDPFYTLKDIPIAPRLDFELNFEYDALTTMLSISGSTGNFPAFDMYYQIANGAIKDLFKLPPAEGTGPFSLFDLGIGLNTRELKGKIELQDVLGG